MPRLTIVAGLALVGLTVGIQGQGAQKAAPPAFSAASRAVSMRLYTQVVIRSGDRSGCRAIESASGPAHQGLARWQAVVRRASIADRRSRVDDQALQPTRPRMARPDYVGTHQVLRKSGAATILSRRHRPDGKTLYLERVRAEMSVLTWRPHGCSRGWGEEPEASP
jgi:hypothetical protein